MPFRWEDIDHSLASLRLLGLSIEMNRLIKGDESRIRFEQLGNLNSSTVPSLILQMQQDRADEWAQRTYEIYCDVWQKQGNAKSAAFLRALFTRGILTVLRGRAMAIASEFSSFSVRTAFPTELQQASLQSLDLNMRRMEDRWYRRLEIEAKECEHAEKRRKNLKTILTSLPENQDQSSIAPHPGNRDAVGSRTPWQASSQPVRSSAPLSEFEATVGKLMVQARNQCPVKYLPQTELLRIGALLDEKQLPVRGNLERVAARAMAEYNQHNPKAAIKTWKAALSHPKFRGAVRKRFSRAEEKHKNGTASAEPPAGTPRTTI